MSTESKPQVVTRDTFLAAKGKRRNVKEITFDDGRKAFIRKLSQPEVNDLLSNYRNDDTRMVEGLRFLVAKGLVDADGNRLFSDSEADAKALADDVDFDDLNHVAAEVSEFTGVGVRQKK